jgi:MFS family permease
MTASVKGRASTAESAAIQPVITTSMPDNKDSELALANIPELVKTDEVGALVGSEVEIEGRQSWLWIPASFRALRNADYRIFWGSVFTSNIGSWIQTIAQGYLVLQLTNSPFMVGLVSFATSLPVLLFSLIGGVVADRRDKRRLLIMTQSLLLTVTMMMALLTLTGLINIWLIIGLSALIGTTNAFNMPAYQSILIDIVGRKDLLNAVALNSAQFNMSRIIGPSLVAPLVALAGFAGCFFINSLSFLAVIIALLTIKIVNSNAGRKATGSGIQNLKDGLAYLRSRPDLMMLIAMAATLTIFAFPYSILMPVMARDVLHVGLPGQGELMAVMGVGATIGALTLAAKSDYPHKGRLIIIGFFTFAVALLVFALSTNFYVSLVAMIFLGAGMITFMASGNTILQANVPSHMRGRVLSVWMLCNMGLVPFGSMQAGTIAEHLGAPFALSVGAIVCALVVVAVAIFVPQIRTLTTDVQPA